MITLIASNHHKPGTPSRAPRYANAQRMLNSLRRGRDDDGPEQPTLTIPLPKHGDRTLTKNDAWSVHSFTYALCLEDRRDMIHRFEKALDHATGLLTRDQTAALAVYVAGLANRDRKHDSADDAAAARLQLVTQTFPTLTAEQQHHVAAIVAALVNQQSDRNTHIRRAVRGFIAHIFGAEDIASLIKTCVGLLAPRRGGAA